MTYQHTHTASPAFGEPTGIDAEEIERLALNAGERLLSFACWLMIAGAGIGLLFIAEKAVQNVLHTLHSYGAC